MMNFIEAKNNVTRISWTSSSQTLVKEMGKASNGGLLCFKDMPIQVPIDAIKNLFDRIYGNEDLAIRLNSVYPKRGIFKDGALDIPDDEPSQVDRKVPFDLSPARLKAIMENDPSLVSALGDEFLQVVQYYKNVQDLVINRLVQLSGEAIGFGADRCSEIHSDMNFNYRLLDYYPYWPKENAIKNMNIVRCGEHRDFGTFTLIFQDGKPGLEVQDGKTGKWRLVPQGSQDVIFLWGWSATILSNGRLLSPLHRVRGSEGGARRNSAVFFVAPNLETGLKPTLIGPGETEIFDRGVTGGLTVAQFKDMMGRRWRKREGTLSTEEEGLEVDANGISQDEGIKAFLQGVSIY